MFFHQYEIAAVVRKEGLCLRPRCIIGTLQLPAPGAMVPEGKPGKTLLRFGVYELDLRSEELRRSGALIKLQPQPFKVLAMLAERTGELVTREELQQAIWGEDTFVDFERGLNFCIKQIRTALGDDADTPRFIETLPRRGYRFLAPVERVGEEPAQVAEPAAPVEPAAPRAPRWWQAWWAWLVTAAALAGLVWAGYEVWREFQGRQRPEKAMLVVLPFENLGNSPEQDFFSDGLTEEMITQLGSLDPQRLGVIARTTAMRYKKTDKTTERIAAELKVYYIVEGSVRREGDHVRITAQLIQARDETHLWAETYERELSGVLALQYEVAQQIADALALELLPEEKEKLARRTPVNPEAYHAYLEGRYYWNNRSLVKGTELFQRAIALDPQFALGYAGLADSYVMMGSTPYDVLPPKDAMPRAKAAALKALELDERLPEAHTALAHTLLYYDWDWAGAEREFKRALELNPSYATARQWYAEYLWVRGRPEEALAQVQLALERDPSSQLVTHFALGRHYYLSREYGQAITRFREWIEMDPGFFLGHFDVGLAYAQAGQMQEAIAAFQRAMELSGRSPLCLAGLGYAYARAGRAAEARQVLAELETLSKRRYVSALYPAAIYVALGDKDRAFDWLERAVDERSTYVVQINVEPVFDLLRSDPRFRALLRRMNFPV